MKCIQSIKATKNVQVGTIVRISEAEAETQVKSGYWKYIPKSEWKLATRKKVETNIGKTSEGDSAKTGDASENNETTKKSKKSSK